jgi:hypothetical protein
VSLCIEIELTLQPCMLEVSYFMKMLTGKTCWILVAQALLMNLIVCKGYA